MAGDEEAERAKLDGRENDDGRLLNLRVCRHGRVAFVEQKEYRTKPRSSVRIVLTRI